MVDSTVAPTNSIEEQSDLGKGDAALWAYWMGQERIAEKAEERWHRQGDLIVKRYRDERPEGPPGASNAAPTDSKFNILWSNVETLKPTLYARTPKPDVDRRFKDNATPAARYAAILLQRCLQFACDTCDFDGVMKPVVEDKLLPGRGVARVLYVPHYGKEIEPQPINPEAAPPAPEALGSAEAEADEEESQEEIGDAEAVVASESDEAPKAEPLREVTYEEVAVKYIYWKDYREGPARQWSEVPWVRYRSYLTRDELKKRFGNKKAALITLDYVPEGHDQSSDNTKPQAPPDLFKKAVIHEYWDKANRSAIWLAPSTPDMILDEQDDPLGLPEFFPNPDPLLATTTTDKRIPVPDYVEYQDQARQLDILTSRIDRLTRALKIAGIYPGDEKQTLAQLIDEGSENLLIPVHDYQNWSDKGGLKAFIEWMPIEQVAQTLIQLHDMRDKQKAILYELTGIGDIMRGMTEPDETLGAQELKAVFATRRITPQQKRVAEFARDLLRLMGGIIAGHFSDKTISLITGFPQLAPVPQLPPRPQMPPQVQHELMVRAAMQAQAQPPAPQAGAPAAAGPQAAPMGGNVVPMAAPPPSVSPSAPGVAPQPPQPPPLSPQAQAFLQGMEQWQQQAQQVQAIQQANQQKQAEFAAACQLIRDDGVHGFKIDIETDSTIAPDEQAEKASRTEFLKQSLSMLEVVVPIVQGNPTLAELVGQLFLFGVRAYPIARPLEETFEKAFEALGKMPPHPSQQAKPGKPQGPTPAEVQLRTKEIDSREQIARETNYVKLADIEQDRQADAAKLANEDAHTRQKLGLEAARAAKQDAIAGARLTHIEARDAGMLT